MIQFGDERWWLHLSHPAHCSPSPSSSHRRKMAGALDFVSHRFKGGIKRVCSWASLWLGRPKPQSQLEPITVAQKNRCFDWQTWKERVLEVNRCHPQKEIGGFCGNGGKQTLEMRTTLLYSCLAHCHLWCLPTGVLTAWDALPFRASPLNLRWTFQASRSLFLPIPSWPRAFPLHFLIFLLDHST